MDKGIKICYYCRKIKEYKMERKIVVVTNNKGKLKEIKEIFSEFELLSLEEVGINKKVKEDENTFKGNALKKAKEIFKVTNMPCIADDSGLCIDVLNGFPGVETARFLGDKASQEDRNRYILEKMMGKTGEERKAKVVCSIAYVDNENEIVVEGVIEGRIAKEERGDNGFGFDPIFELEDGKTLAQLSVKRKNEISSRRIALEKLRSFLTE